jgi:hypothetical protein
VDPQWRRWYRRSTAPTITPPGRPSVDGLPGASPRISVRLPAELQARTAALARWRRTSVAVVVRAALEHYLDEGVGGRAGRPRPGRCAAPGAPTEPEFDPAAAYADPAAHPDGGTDADDERASDTLLRDRQRW